MSTPLLDYTPNRQQHYFHTKMRGWRQKEWAEGKAGEQRKSYRVEGEEEEGEEEEEGPVVSGVHTRGWLFGLMKSAEKEVVLRVPGLNRWATEHAEDVEAVGGGGGLA